MDNGRSAPLVGGGAKPPTKPPNRIILVPEQYRQAVSLRELQGLVHQWKTEHGCAVVPETAYRPGKEPRYVIKFNVFGSGSSLENTVRDINKWIMSARTDPKTVASREWAKMRAFDSGKWYEGQLKLMKAERKQKFKGLVPDDDTPLHEIVVGWPKNLREHNPPIMPRDVFGHTLEGLDTIRMDDEVYITLMPNISGQIRIQGYKAEHVDAAEAHYRTLVQRVQIKKFGSKEKINIVLDVAEGLHIVLEAAPSWWPTRTHRIVPFLPHFALMNEPGSFREDPIDWRQLNVIQHVLGVALNTVRYERGYYDLTIRYGCFALSSDDMPDSEIGKTYDKSEFQKGIDGRVDSEVKKWLMNSEEGDQLLERLMVADQILEPTKSGGYFGFTPTTLKETRPIFRGTWVFKDPNTLMPGSGLIRSSGRPPAPGSRTVEKQKTAPHVVVQIDWTDDEEGCYERMAPRYFRLKPDNVGVIENLDINLLELGEGKAWHFGLESMMPATTSSIPPAVIGFANRVTLTPGYANGKNLESKEAFAQWSLNPSLKLLTGRLDKVYTFGIAKTNYKVEFFASWYPSKSIPCWALVVRHLEWATHLAELERLPPGEKASWGDVITTFIPDDGITSTASQDNSNPEEEELDLQNLRLDMASEAQPREGIRLLTQKLMELSQVINDRGGVAV
ncbi:hypothetical protein BDV95DRAFT_497090 [Massariosphaeria phaeospora]|uniref:DUF7905 domain-containing protein n=1 Tax=Massariosphaeria phaeospora TaxID=100035 RepID=A0A7C8I3E3_9PLEO|nr:hypothetical protein BDV95DRAFT_497090 [Massariosphaeria phaeospora]